MSFFDKSMLLLSVAMAITGLQGMESFSNFERVIPVKFGKKINTILCSKCLVQRKPLNKYLCEHAHWSIPWNQPLPYIESLLFMDFDTMPAQ